MAVGLVVAVLGGLLIPLYWLTLAPHATWANLGSDSGELIAVAVVRGVPHPTGYPTYLLLLHLLDLLPLPIPSTAPALRYGLLSVLSATATAIGIALVVVRLPSAMPPLARPLLLGVAILTALSYATTALVWSQAVIVEVYSLHTLWVVLLILLLPQPPRWWHGLVIGLALGHHRTSLLLILVWVAVQLVRRTPVAVWLRVLAGVAGGLLVYLLLPLRAASVPPINWGNAATWEGFWWLVQARYFQGFVQLPSPSAALERLHALGLLGLHQFGVLLGLAGYGIVRGGRLPAWGLGLPAFVALQISFTLIYTSTDWQVHLLPVWVVVAIWVGWGAVGLLHALARHTPQSARWLAAGGGTVWVGVLLLCASQTLPQVDGRRDPRAMAFADAVWAAAPAGAIIYAGSDQDIFALWYGHYALAARPDVAVIAEPLIVYAWYRQALREQYAWLHVPTGADESRAWAEWLAELRRLNPHAPHCRTQLEGAQVLQCGDGAGNPNPAEHTDDG